MNSLDWSIGLRVKVTTILDKSITGKVYSFDPITNTITLEEGKNFRVIKSSFIRDITNLDKAKKPQPAQSFVSAEPAIGPVSINGAIKRQHENVQRARKVLLSKGVGVSPEGQFVFDVLSRTLPCKWQGKSIVVFDEIVVKPPYTPESCSAGKDGNANSNALELVRKNVVGAQDKLGRELKGG